MEEDQKNAEAAKMISNSTTDPQKEEPSQTETETSFKNIKEVGDVPMHDSSSFAWPLSFDSSPNITPKKEVGGDGAMKDSSTFRRSLLLESSPNITPKKRKEGPETDTSFAEKRGLKLIRRLRRRPRGSASGSKKRKEEPSLSTSSETQTKKRLRRPPPKLTPCLIDLNAGQDVVDIIYNISVANPHRMFSIISAVGPISDVALFTQTGLARQKGEFEILSISVRSLVGDDGRHCRAKAMCSVSWIDNKGNMYASTSVNSLIAAGPTKIITASFHTDNAKKAGARILVSAAAAAQNGDSDSKMLVEGQTSRHSPKPRILPIRRVVDRKIFPIEATPLQMIAPISDPAKEYYAKVIKEAASRTSNN